MITYPAGVSTPKQKLGALANLITQLIAEHNRTGSIAMSNWPAYRRNWLAYKRRFHELVLPILVEEAHLRQEVRQGYLRDDEFAVLPLEEKHNLHELIYSERETTATSDTLDELHRLDLASLTTADADPYVDWTTWTEVDSGGYLTVTANQITVTNMPRGVDSKVYKDFGTGFWGSSFTFMVDSRLVSGTVYENPIVCVHLANTVPTNYDPDIELCQYKHPNGSRIFVATYDPYPTGDYKESGDLAVNTIYYLTLVRNSTAVTAYIYSDSARTNLLYTLSITTGTSSYRYIICTFASSGSGSPVTGDIYNLDLGIEEEVTLEQEGFRWRYDDGDEDEATWIADQDTNITRAKNLNTRLRIIINATGNPPSAQYQLEYKKSTESTWHKVQ